ncbi:MAG: hypothetical protein VB099_15560 [Candidatus Limiplasma sp.]|nr:hypothetical protein [Candidatus Limiplasma sp.]
MKYECRVAGLPGCRVAGLQHGELLEKSWICFLDADHWFAKKSDLEMLLGTEALKRYLKKEEMPVET